MPLYMYRALTTDGHIVKNRIEDTSKSSIIKRIKRNGLTPISVVQLKARTQKNKKNINNVEKMLENLNNGSVIKKPTKRKVSTKEKLANTLVKSNRITSKDIIVFTQKFYLLKKANFNNIHALSTIIESTENPKFKEILEDMQAGLESGENMYSTMEYYQDVFPYIYINMIRVGELSRFFDTITTTSSKISRRNRCNK
ncbi:MAG: type II secretion system F family protein [Clostridia bacterium]|nr:type II secretion system F family protein [Clostridia bacterium]